MSEKPFEFLRLGEIDEKGLEHLDYISNEKLKDYDRDVITGIIFCFAVYIDGERVGTTLADMGYRNDEKIMTCLETGGEGAKVEKHYLGMYIALCNVFECKKFVIGTQRKAMMKLAEKAGMKKIYSEYCLDVKE